MEEKKIVDTTSDVCTLTEKVVRKSDVIYVVSW